MALGNFAMTNCTLDGNSYYMGRWNFMVNSGGIEDAGNFSVDIAFKYVTGSNNSTAKEYALLHQGKTKGLFRFYWQNNNAYSNRFWVRVSDNGSFSNNYTDIGPITLTRGANYVFTLTVSNDQIILYQNAQLWDGFERNYTPFEPDGRLCINCEEDTSGNLMTGGVQLNLYALNVYDRVLSPEEVLQNFENYNTRFNLGF